MASFGSKKKKKKEDAGSVTYVCIRECQDRGRVWKPVGKAVRKKDYLLVADENEEVSSKNFMKVEKDPGLDVKAPKPKALSEMKPGDEFLT